MKTYIYIVLAVCSFIISCNSNTNSSIKNNSDSGEPSDTDDDTGSDENSTLPVRYPFYFEIYEGVEPLEMYGEEVTITGKMKWHPLEGFNDPTCVTLERIRFGFLGDVVNCCHLDEIENECCECRKVKEGDGCFKPLYLNPMNCAEELKCPEELTRKIRIRKGSETLFETEAVKGEAADLALNSFAFCPEEEFEVDFIWEPSENGICHDEWIMYMTYDNHPASEPEAIFSGDFSFYNVISNAPESPCMSFLGDEYESDETDCIECLSNENCSGNRDICEDKRCIQCHSDSDCLPGETCTIPYNLCDDGNEAIREEDDGGEWRGDD